MANMFSGNKQKKVPSNLFECYANDKLTNNLWIWCERLETIGIILAVIVGIAAFVVGVAMFDVTDGVSLLISLLGAPIIAFLEYITFHIIALLVGSLASIVQHTKISANISLYKYSVENNKHVVDAKTDSKKAQNNDKQINQQTKNIIKDSEINDSETNDSEINDLEINDLETYISVACPFCNRELHFSTDVIQPYCPYCDKVFDLKL